MANELRSEGIASLWRKAVRVVTGQPVDETDIMENGYIPLRTEAELAQKDTPSAQFAHCTVEDTLAQFRTSPDHGLSSSQIPDLQSTHGYNEFSVSTPEPLLLKFAKTIYESPLILLLCASAVISAIMGNIDDAVSITVAVLIVLTVGFVQERRSEKSLEALNKLVPHHCHVLRDGQSIHILANELVPGDIITLTTGDRVPADVRLVAAVDLEIDESSLTGETEARKKGTEACAFDVSDAAGQKPAALADRTCVGYMGTLVRNGGFGYPGICFCR
jgi:Ca2+-transporting ATPase